MPTEPSVKRAIAFFDGQNLYHAAKAAFGHTFPNYDPVKLAMAVCQSRGWQLEAVRFYTGVPDRADDPRWNQFWAAKFLHMSRQNVHVFSRPLRYRNQRVRLQDGSEYTFMAAEEKGIDVRIAIDVIREAHHRDYDVAVIFSQDQDLSEVAEEVRVIAREQARWIKVASAFPVSPVIPKQRGIDKTDWIPIDRALYDACLDPRDYRATPPAS
jgi:uncharacterized LabA/DUF88 family protein